MMTFWKELRSRIQGPTVQEQETEVINDAVRQVVLTNENAIQPAPVGTSAVASFNEKEGANETAGTAI